MADPAPFFSEISGGSADVETFWVKAEDGVRLRLAIWPEGEKGTIFLFNGRTEYLEKYGHVADEYRQRGFASISIDWRGQGLSDRLIPDRMAGFVHSFSDYQKDVAVLLAHASQLNLPKPYFLVAHSMGGLIGLRALLRDLPVQAAAFSAPMFGVAMSAAMRPFAWGLSWAGRRIGKGSTYVPGSADENYALSVTFEENSLTSDRKMFEHIQNQLRTQPQLSLGGATYHWLNEALMECRRVARQKSPAYPTLTMLGSEEEIVDPDAVHNRMARWPNGRLELIDGAEHELMVEKPEIRHMFFDRTAAHFSANT